jgi:hypothetical protein
MERDSNLLLRSNWITTVDIMKTVQTRTLAASFSTLWIQMQGRLSWYLIIIFLILFQETWYSFAELYSKYKMADTTNIVESLHSVKEMG